MKLKDKAAIITGGSGGIGKAVAKIFLHEGARVVIADVSKIELDNAIVDLKGEGELIGIRADVSEVEDVQSLVEQTLKLFGHIDVLINAAGVQGPIGLLPEVGIQEWINTLNVNLIGTVICCKASLPIMINKKRGKIINFAGGGANYSRPNFSAYGVSKAGIVRFTEILADELKASNIQVNVVSPGVIKTRMIDEILKAGPEKAGDEYHQLQSRLVEGFDSSDSVSELICYLASDQSDWITGKVISTMWDPWRNWMENGPVKIDKDMYVLRRIDGRNFIKVNT